MDVRSLYVRAGDLVKPAWNKLLDVLLSFRILAGPGILLSRTSGGVVVNARALTVGFPASWDVQMSGDQVSFSMGLVDGLEPLIDGRPISGSNDPKGAPKLKLDSKKYDETGRSWLCVRGEIDPATGKILQPIKDEVTGKITGELKLTMFQSAKLPPDPDDTVAFFEVALLYRGAKDKSGFGVLHKVRWFDQKHTTVKQNGKWRHFFNAA